MPMVGLGVGGEMEHIAHGVYSGYTPLAISAGMSLLRS